MSRVVSPAGHGAQAAEPAALAKLPASHSSHSAPARAAVPAGHGEHSAAPSVEIRPGSHATHAAGPKACTVPSRCTSGSAGAADFSPAPHGAHSAAPPSENQPGSHGTQRSAPALRLNVPGRHGAQASSRTSSRSPIVTGYSPAAHEDGPPIGSISEPRSHNIFPQKIRTAVHIPPLPAFSRAQSILYCIQQTSGVRTFAPSSELVFAFSALLLDVADRFQGETQFLDLRSELVPSSHM